MTALGILPERGRKRTSTAFVEDIATVVVEASSESLHGTAQFVHRDERDEIAILSVLFEAELRMKLGPYQDRDPGPGPSRLMT
ncbi:hypothetical protein TNCV_89431 [Trichonephila clavipes]|nr:hypothetical protein TNCV_89431 [Trichonephila clavipes]